MVEYRDYIPTGLSRYILFIPLLNVKEHNMMMNPVMRLPSTFIFILEIRETE
jgi:hypothetical protein